jgi:hypothetical protein
MVGKLHKSWPGGHVYMLVAVDKFTKWVEAAPVTTQDSTAALDALDEARDKALERATQYQ